jgi:RNA polymerase sigma factor (sigma-70 family)
MPDDQQTDLNALAALARKGDRDALEVLVRAIQKDVYNLAVRFLWHPQDAEDATQEILIRIITGLATFEGRSRFRTWVYRVASNALLTQGRKRMEQAALSFDAFAEALADGLAPGTSEPSSSASDDPAEALMLEEVKIGCTHAMLLCLDRDHRLAYILGEVLDLDHGEGADILVITRAAFRKRLSRATQRITSFMTGHCGLIDSGNQCRCRLKIGCAIKRGHVRPEAPLFAQSLTHAQRFPEVLRTIRQLEQGRRAAALYRSHPDLAPSTPFNTWLKQLLTFESG